MTTTQASPIIEIRQSTVNFIQRTIEKYCEERGLTIQSRSGPGFPRRKLPKNQLHCVLITKERCNWEYPGLEEKAHFHCGVQLVVKEAPDEHGPDYAELAIFPEHMDVAGYATIDLTLLQDQICNQSDWSEVWTLRIQGKLDDGMELEEQALDHYKKRAE